MNASHFTFVFRFFKFKVIEDLAFSARVGIIDKEPLVSEFVVIEILVSVQVYI